MYLVALPPFCSATQSTAMLFAVDWQPREERGPQVLAHWCSQVAGATAHGASSPSVRALKAVAGVNLVTTADQVSALDEKVRHTVLRETLPAGEVSHI